MDGSHFRMEMSGVTLKSTGVSCTLSLHVFCIIKTGIGPFLGTFGDSEESSKDATPLGLTRNEEFWSRTEIHGCELAQSLLPRVLLFQAGIGLFQGLRRAWTRVLCAWRRPSTPPSCRG